ncbi:MAG: DegT/DnrJ/EryC1/StrS family aminotransferase [Nanobdellota archaeon]
MKIAFKGLQREYQYLKKDLDKKIIQALSSEELIDENLTNEYSASIKLFEKNFAQFCATKFCMGTNSGTSALYLALIGLGINKGDEVIVPVNTYIATALAVEHTGAKPIFVDVLEETFEIDYNKIEDKINQKTKAIIPVHLYGQCCNMDKIKAIADKYNLKIIEDAAQAHGALYKDKKAGNMGNVGCFSFYANKNLNANGDGGALVSNNYELIKNIDMMREYRGIHSGEELLANKRFPTKLSPLPSIILTTKLKYLDKLNTIRRKIANYYNKNIRSENIKLPKESPNRKHVYFAYVVRHKKRHNLRKFLEKHGIPTMIEYEVPLHLQKTFSYMNHKEGDFPVAEKLSKEILSLPIHPFLRKKEILYICETINHFF